MIRVRCLGHIGTSLGMKEVSLPEDGIDAGELLEKVRKLSRLADPGFTKYNTLVLVEDGEAFVPAAVKKQVRGGDTVVLIPFSHGG